MAVSRCTQNHHVQKQTKTPNKTNTQRIPMTVLKVKTHSDITEELVFDKCPGFVVQAKHLSHTELAALIRRASDRRIDRRTGRETYDLNEEKFAHAAPDAYIVGWRGLKPEHFPFLGIDLEEPPDTDADGCVPYSPELARELWTYADDRKFAAIITEFSDRLLELRAEAKAHALKN